MLDLLLGQFRWWRKRSGGIWYLVRSNMHPAGESWGRDRPEESPYDTVIAREYW